MSANQAVNGSTTTSGATHSHTGATKHSVIVVTETTSLPQQSGTRVAVGDDAPVDAIVGAAIYIDLTSGEVYAQDGI